MIEIVPLLSSIAIPNVGGFLSSLSISMKTLNEWYDTLELPSWRPPNWLFAPAWLVLYSLIGVASYLVWRTNKHDPFVGLVLLFYVLHLILNYLWSIFFFGLRDPQLGLFMIWVVNITALITAVLFYRVNKTAGLLFLPYLLWLAYATALNTYIVEKTKNDD